MELPHEEEGATKLAVGFKRKAKSVNVSKQTKKGSLNRPSLAVRHQ